ncbi:MAG: hypothetical protein HYY04_15815 [Chloroflexi bacterium]|nr:hypothetical protein [Chloroflexota bacterium]
MSDFAKDAFDTLGQLDLAPGQWVRLVVLVSAEKLPVWFGLPDGDRLQWESQGGAAVLYRWSVDALRRRLAEMDLPSASEIAAEEIAKATGGYSILIESLFSVGTAKPDIKLAARLKTLASHLADPASETATAFRSALGMDTWELARPLYQTLASLLGEDEYADEDQLAALASEELGRAAPEIRSALLALERLGILDRRAGQLALEPLARRVLAPAADNQ